MEGKDINLKKYQKLLIQQLMINLIHLILMQKNLAVNINENYQIERVEKLILELQNNLNNNYEKIKNLFDPQKKKMN